MEEYTFDTVVHILANAEYQFMGLMELGSIRKWIYGFTSKEKAENFLRVTRRAGLFEAGDRFFPCTLAEWFEIKAKRKLPDLAIDPDPEAVRDYPLIVGDMSKHNISSVTVELPSGDKVYRVAVSPRQHPVDR
jgi:hypothetical protein